MWLGIISSSANNQLSLILLWDSTHFESQQVHQSPCKIALQDYSEFKIQNLI